MSGFLHSLKDEIFYSRLSYKPRSKFLLDIAESGSYN